MADEKDPRQFFQPQPSAAQKALWDEFVSEYVKDWNAVQAAMRVGFNLAYAQEYCKIFMSEPYVQRKIQEFKTKPAVDEDSRKASLKAEIEATLRAAMNCGDPKVQVAAAAKLGEMHGLMEAPDKTGSALRELVDGFKEVARNLPD